MCNYDLQRNELSGGFVGHRRRERTVRKSKWLWYYYMILHFLKTNLTEWGEIWGVLSSVSSIQTYILKHQRKRQL